MPPRGDRAAHASGRAASRLRGGRDSTLATYDELREHFYGRAAYDFGAVPLVDVANRVRGEGSLADAVALHELNARMNPNSAFAKQQHAGAALLLAFTEDGEASGPQNQGAAEALRKLVP